MPVGKPDGGGERGGADRAELAGDLQRRVPQPAVGEIDVELVGVAQVLVDEGEVHPDAPAIGELPGDEGVDHEVVLHPIRRGQHRAVGPLALHAEQAAGHAAADPLDAGAPTGGRAGAATGHALPARQQRRGADRSRGDPGRTGEARARGQVGGQPVEAGVDPPLDPELVQERDRRAQNAGETQCSEAQTHVLINVRYPRARPRNPQPVLSKPSTCIGVCSRQSCANQLA